MNPNNLFIILATALLVGCSAQWHMQRAVLKNPELLTSGQTVRFDTVVITQTQVLNDTTILRVIDSVVITQNNVVTKLWRNHDTVRVQTICPPDTVRINVVKQVPQIIYQPRTWWQRNNWWLVLLAVVAVAGFYVARRFLM